MRLRSHLIILAAIAILPLMVSSVVALAIFVRHERAGIEKSTVERVRALSTAVDAELRSAITTLLVLATSRHLDDGGSLESFYADARRALASQSDWLTINLAAPSGEQIVNPLRSFGAALPPLVDRGSLEAVVTTGKPAIGDLVHDPLSGQDGFPVRVPIIRRGALRYVLSAIVKPQVMTSLLSRQGIPDDWVVSILDRSDRHVGRTRAIDRYLGNPASPELRAALARSAEGWYRGHTLEGQEIYAAFSRSHVTGWAVAIGIPVGIVDAPLRPALAWLTVGILVSTALALGLAILNTRAIVQPLVRLTEGAKGVTLGEPPGHRGTAIAEVAELGRALDEAAAVIRERELSHRLLAALVDSSSDAIIGFGSGGFITTWNAAAERLFGYRAGEAIGRHVSFLSPPEKEDEQRQLLASVMAGATAHVETVRLTQSGALVEVAITDAPILDAQGNAVGVSAIVRDISAQKAIERERASLLEQALSARADAEAASRAKDEFLAMLGHELRTPLAAISTAVHVLNRLVGGQQGDVVRACEVIGRQAERLARLVDDLLDVGRLMTGKILLNRKPADLAEIVQHCVATAKTASPMERHDLALEAESVWVEADIVRVEQVIDNLLSNAAKFTPPGGRIRVMVGREESDAVIRVEDTGSGIAADLLPRIFDLFVQGPQTLDRVHGGLGIGLTLVRRLVELHGGTVEAASDGPGRGSVFTVRLPAIAASRADERRPKVPEPHAGPRRVLIVEDHADTRETLKLLLELQGHEVLEASDGQAAVETILREHPDLALIDIGLPGLDGYAVARQVRAHPGGQEIVLVALTGYGLGADRERAREAGFDVHLVKPFHPNQLKEILGKPRTPRNAPNL